SRKTEGGRARRTPGTAPRRSRSLAAGGPVRGVSQIPESRASCRPPSHFFRVVEAPDPSGNRKLDLRFLEAPLDQLGDVREAVRAQLALQVFLRLPFLDVLEPHLRTDVRRQPAVDASGLLTCGD